MTSNEPGKFHGATATTVGSNDPRLYVMISSTTVDLPDHRRAASDAIQQMGHTSVMMEHGSAEWNSDAIKSSLEKVEKSNVYIGIFGLRYGFIPKDAVRNPNRLSITEIELRHAQKLGIPILIYIARTSHPFEEDQIDFESEKAKKLKCLKNELSSGHVVGFFDGPVELQCMIMQSLHALYTLNADLDSSVDVFISYSSEDTSIANVLCHKLESRGIRCWIAPRDILPSQDYPEAIINAIEECRILVLLFSSSSNSSPFVKAEVERAFAKEVPILPFRIVNERPSKKLELLISGAHWLDAINPPIEQHMERLVDAAKRLLKK